MNSIVTQDPVIVSLGRASLALSEAKTIQQTKQVLDVAAAAEIYARRQHLGEEAEGIAVSIKVEALRKLGEMLQRAPKATGAKGIGPIAVKDDDRNQPQTLAELGLTKNESAVAQKLAALSEDEFAQVRDGNVTVSKAIAAVATTKATPRDVPTSGPVTIEDGPSLDEILAELRAEVTSLSALVAAAEADDAKAEVIKWRRAYDNAVRQQSEAMDRASKAVEREKWTAKQLARCGKAVGQEDPTAIAAAVEGFVRAHRVAV